MEYLIKNEKKLNQIFLTLIIITLCTILTTI